MTIDEEVVLELQKDQVGYSKMTMSTDEDEHSIEMHLPFVQMIMQGYASFRISAFG
jgi:AmmeMemoRadiSam system protein B